MSKTWDASTINDPHQAGAKTSPKATKWKCLGALPNATSTVTGYQANIINMLQLGWFCPGKWIIWPKNQHTISQHTSLVLGLLEESKQLQCWEVEHLEHATTAPEVIGNSPLSIDILKSVPSFATIFQHHPTHQSCLTVSPHLQATSSMSTALPPQPKHLAMVLALHHQAMVAVLVHRSCGKHGATSLGRQHLRHHTPTVSWWWS